MTHLTEEDYAAIDLLQSLKSRKQYMTLSLEALYQAIYTSNDIVEHLPRLREMASQCEHVTEFGTRYGNSTVALLAGQPKTLISYDIVNQEIGKELKLIQGKTNFEFRVADSREVEIEETDMLFIDTVHKADQLRSEFLQAPKVRKWIVMHDTHTYAKNGEGGGVGLKVAIEEFLEEFPIWFTRLHTDICNGLTILERKVPIVAEMIS